MVLPPDQFRRTRSTFPGEVGRVGPLTEERDAFVVRVTVQNEPGVFRGVIYSVAKAAWEDWWAKVESGLEEKRVAATAQTLRGLPITAGRSGIERACQIVPANSGNLAQVENAATCNPDDTWMATGTVGAPSERAGHTAVWTGSLMVVWGGGGAGDYAATGGRYDPATDTWSPTSIVGAPSGRYRHSAVWTGDLMVIWGGPWYSTGGRYDPATDTWTTTSTVGAPLGRVGSSVVWTGRVMVIWGGFAPPDLNSLNTGGRYDPASDTWTPTSTVGAPTARYDHSAVWTGSEMVVWGGGSNTGGRYDPVADTWTETSTVGSPSARGGHSAVWTGSVMVVWGGNGGGYDYLNTGGRYDPTTDTWMGTSTVGSPSARGGHSAVWTGTVMIVWGGSVYDDSAQFLSTGGQYDPTTDTWTATSIVGPPTGREFHSAVWTGSVMVIWGGEFKGETDYYYAMNTGGRYDPVRDTWTATSTAGPPSARSSHTAVWTGSFMIIWGGKRSDNGSVNTGGLYDPATDTWRATSIAGAPSGRYSHTAVWTGTVMVVWGGQLPTVGLVNTGGRYDPATDTWWATSTVGAPSARYFHTAVWTGSTMVVWGGSDGSTYLSAGGRYDPAADTWTVTSTVGAPSERSFHTAVWTGTEMVVWGGDGYEGTYHSLNSGGRYDPVMDRWTATSTSGAPAGRYYHTAVWTGIVMVVWGGNDGDYGYVNTGGRYDPAADTWLGTSTVGAPSARESHTVAWTGSAMVVWGGHAYASSDISFNSGGRYDPDTDTWTATVIAGTPSARFSHTAVWTGSAMVIWGGQSQDAGGDLYFNTGGLYVLGDPDEDGDGDGYSYRQGDCNDCNAAVYPGAPELCDGINNNCSDPEWPATPANELNTDGDAFRICQGDCDDADASVFPGAPQLCDSTNNDCGDPAWPAVPANEADADGDGFRICSGDCDDWNPLVHVGAVELCNGLDDNCDGQIDEGVLATFYRDADGDGYGNPSQSVQLCHASPGFVNQDGDCDDTRSSVYPSAPEVCNFIDDNCNGEIDENFLGLDTDGDGVHNSCDNCLSVYNPSQLDSDHDGRGNSCDNCIAFPNPDQTDTDADSVGNGCDNCPTEYNPAQADADADTVGDACDNCLSMSNRDQADSDQDNEGDACDWNDGLLYFTRIQKGRLTWQPETVYSHFNLYRGSLDRLRVAGEYTQDVIIEPDAGVWCNLMVNTQADAHLPSPGRGNFYLITGRNSSGESSLGMRSDGTIRPNHHPCP